MRHSMLVASLFLLASLPQWSTAQTKLPIFEESSQKPRNVVYQEATDGQDLKNGTLVRVTLDDKSKDGIYGVLVRSDPAKQKIYVRTTAGALPQAFDMGRVKRIDKGVRQVADKGAVVAPEIQQIEIINGARRTIAYHAPTLSPQELAVLDEMQSSENELNRLESLARLRDRAIENDLALLREQRRTRHLLNLLIAQQLNPFPTNVVNGLNAPFGIWGGWAPDSYGYYYRPAMNTNSNGLLSETILMAMAAAPPVRMDQVTTQSLAVDENQLVNARRHYLTMVRRGISENGRLVAVIVNDSEPTSK
jgi:hypothetical protein